MNPISGLVRCEGVRSARSAWNTKVFVVAGYSSFECIEPLRNLNASRSQIVILNDASAPVPPAVPTHGVPLLHTLPGAHCAA